MKEPSIKSIFFIIGPDGKIWHDSARINHDDCRNSFVRDWLSPIASHLDNHTCWQVFGAFQRAGYRIEELEINLPKQ